MISDGRMVGTSAEGWVRSGMGVRRKGHPSSCVSKMVWLYVSWRFTREHAIICGQKWTVSIHVWGNVFFLNVLKV